MKRKKSAIQRCTDCPIEWDNDKGPGNLFGGKMKVNTNDLKWYGRYSDLDGIRYFDYSASGFEFCFTGKKAVVSILSDPELFDDNTKV